MAKSKSKSKSTTKAPAAIAAAVDPLVQRAAERVLDAAKLAWLAETSPALLRVGDRARWVPEPGFEDFPVQIVGAFGVYACKAGPRPGYMMRMEDGHEYFAPAHKLVATDGEVQHLRLVARP